MPARRACRRARRTRRDARASRSRRGRGFHPLELLFDDALRLELGEERAWLAQRLTWRKRARLPVPRPGAVVTREHDMSGAVLVDRSELEFARDHVVVAEELVQPLR